MVEGIVILLIIAVGIVGVNYLINRGRKDKDS
jgi:hypothetical protein